eukprot:3352311-Rhodomonas_salina.1
MSESVRETSTLHASSISQRCGITLTSHSSSSSVRRCASLILCVGASGRALEEREALKQEERMRGAKIITLQVRRCCCERKTASTRQGSADMIAECVAAADPAAPGEAGAGAGAA